jgi:lipoprotein-anchoring transpeptidase ErfK/SrfK
MTDKIQNDDPKNFREISSRGGRFSLRGITGQKYFKYIKGGLLLILFIIVYVYIFQIIPDYTVSLFVHKQKIDTISAEDQNISRLTRTTENSIRSLARKFAGLSSNSTYIVINTTANEFYLYRNQKMIRQGTCSTGSYILLESGDEQKWIFKTPKGQFRIQGKTTSPVWIKPDWAFVEEGLPVPPPNHESRYERGVLGDYALSLGHGYLIHGTLYQRFLGLPVTHGCIRLNDEDLNAVYHSLSIGSRVFIY